MSFPGRGLYETLLTELVQELLAASDSTRDPEISELRAAEASDRLALLGPATYVRHQRERPMAVTWRLHHSLPGDLFQAFAAAVA